MGDVKISEFSALEPQQMAHAMRLAMAPLIEELRALPEQMEMAKINADVTSIKATRKRESELHSKLLEMAAEHKKKFSAYLATFQQKSQQMSDAAETSLTQARIELERLKEEFQKKIESQTDLFHKATHYQNVLRGEIGNVREEISVSLDVCDAQIRESSEFIR